MQIFQDALVFFTERRVIFMKKYCIIKSPIGNLKICEQENFITQVFLTDEYEKAEYSDLLYETYKQLNEYFRGNRKKFDLPLKLNGTEFQNKVWNELQKIPYGQTVCYEEIAVRIGNKNAVRAVGQANNKNPIMIIIPCHRVINKNGDIGGFGCGNNIKRYLLNLENDYK